MPGTKPSVRGLSDGRVFPVVEEGKIEPVLGVSYAISLPFCQYSSCAVFDIRCGKSILIVTLPSDASGLLALWARLVSHRISVRDMYYDRRQSCTYRIFVALALAGASSS